VRRLVICTWFSPFTGRMLEEVSISPSKHSYSRPLFFIPPKTKCVGGAGSGNAYLAQLSSRPDFLFQIIQRHPIMFEINTICAATATAHTWCCCWATRWNATYQGFQGSLLHTVSVAVHLVHGPRRVPVLLCLRFWL
jgi:hypothetical protein